MGLGATVSWYIMPAILLFLCLVLLLGGLLDDTDPDD